ncbi:Metallo-dependent hydrolase [Thozetella sp. PMI_491]|nr:Metallo-dependent hydrolase [Thozetella sp. PMI_491]
MGAKYIIKNATVVSMDSKIGNVSNCDVVVEDGFITAVGPNLNHSDHEVIDGTNAIVSPGFVDTHRHTWQTQIRSITTDFVLSDYLLTLRNIYGSCYTAHDAYLGNYCGALESIDNGITYIVDHSHIMNSPEHSDAAVRGLKDARIRAVFCYCLFPNPAWSGSSMDKAREDTTPDWRVQDARRIRDQHFPSNDVDELVRFGFAPAELETTPFEQVAREIEVGRSLGAAVITGHVAVGKYDVGNTLVRKLGEKGMLGPDLLFSHGATLQDDELAAISKNGIGLSSTPDTELQMAMGHPIAFKAQEHSCIASIGVDICSNSPADMFQQMRLLLQIQRHVDNESKAGPPAKVTRRCAEVLEMATLGGAKAVGLGDIIGSITPGKRADLLITRCDSTRLVPMHDPVGALVLYANGSDIDTVFINGEIVKAKGKLTGVDWPKVREELRASAASIMEKSKAAPTNEVQAAGDAMVNDLATKK